MGSSSDSETILLCLVNNDPTSTVLMTPAGQPLYCITTPRSLPSVAVDDTSSSRAGSVTAGGAARPTLADKHGNSSNADKDSYPMAPSPPRRTHSMPIDTVNVNEPHGGAGPSGGGSKSSECHVRKGSTTIVKRLDDHRNVSRGHAETTVGLIRTERDSDGLDDDDEKGSSKERVVLELCEEGYTMRMPSPPSRRQTTQIKGKAPMGALPSVQDKGDGDSEAWDMIGYWSDSEWVVVSEDSDSDEATREAMSSWDFIGPDKKHYKWHMLVHSPVLARVENNKSYTHIARFRRPKLGIVSRSRKGFLEIYPNANASMDFIVTSFVGFMKQCVLPSDRTIGPATGVASSPLNPASVSDHGRLGFRGAGAAAGSSSGPDSNSSSRPSDPKTTNGETPRPRAATTTSSTTRTNQFGHASRPERACTMAAQQTTHAPDMALPPRFVSAVALARKHSRSPPETAFTFPPFLVKPKVRSVHATGPGESGR